MKNVIILVILLAGAYLFPQTETIRILSVNDSHSYLVPGSPRLDDNSGTIGGIARIASIFGYARMQDPNTILLHAGDFSIGDPFYNIFFGVPELQILKSLQIDAMSAGNHEFDVGCENLYGILTQGDSAGFPILSANANLDPFPALTQFIKPFTVKQYGTVKVGIFGLTTPETNLLSNINPCSMSEDLINISAAMVDTLTKLDCKVIICLSHLGIGLDTMAIAKIPGINVIAGGHDHMKTNSLITMNNGYNDVYIMQGGSFYENVCSINLNVSSTGVTLESYTLIPVNSDTPEEPTVKEIVNGLAAQIESTYGIPIFSSPVCTASGTFNEVADNLLTPGKKSTGIGNFVTDAFRWKTGSDIAITAGGSTARQIDSGKVLGVDLFRTVGYGLDEATGFGFKIKKIKMTGEALLKGLAVGLSQPANDEFLLQVSGMRYAYSISDTLLNPDTVIVNGSPINTSTEYSVTINEGLYQLLTMFGIEFTPVESYDYTEFQVLAEYCQNLGTITPDTIARISAYDNISGTSGDINNTTPENFNLSQNYPNPFNPSTTIEYSLAKRANVTLEIFNVIGERVNVLVNSTQDGGFYKINFNSAGSLSSGVYFYRLHAVNVSDNKGYLLVKKMILLK